MNGLHEFPAYVHQCPDTTGKRWFNDENAFIHLETATALRRGSRVIPGLARLAYLHRSANKSTTADFGEGLPGGVLSRVIEFGNDGEGSFIISDERLGGTAVDDLKIFSKERLK